MSKEFRILLFLAIAAAAFVTTAGATTVVFTETFTIAPGPPQIYDRSVAVDLSDSCDGRATYAVRVVSGDAKHGVTSAIISLNGSTLLRESDFKNAPQSFEMGFAAAATNALHVALKGGNPGSTVTVSVLKTIEETLFSKTYTLTNGKTESSDPITVSDASATYVLMARNGDTDGNHRAKKISIRVNGAEVLTEGSLVNGQLVRRVVVLQPSSVVSASITGVDGDVVSVAIHKQLDESVCVALAIAITSPADGATVTMRPLLVRGTVLGRRDVGVSVNGAAAQLDLTHSGAADDPIPWVAVLNAVPGGLTINATATAISGVHRDAAVAIVYDPPRDAADLRAVPPGGTAPFDTQFHVTLAPGQTLVTCELDLDGDGVYERTLTSLPMAIPFHYDTPGLRIASARVTYANGHVSLSSVPVEVESLSLVNGIIQARWSTFRALLTAGDIETALTYFAGDAEREKYRGPLQLIKPTLPQFVAEMGPIRPIYIRGDVAYYLLTRDVGGSLEGFPVYFTRGTDGLWKIVQF